MFLLELHVDTTYWPITHDEQFEHLVIPVAPKVVEYLPDWQSVQLAGLTAPMIEEYVPAWHCMQKLELELASPVEYVPAMQLRHLLDTVAPIPIW